MNNTSNSQQDQKAYVTDLGSDDQIEITIDDFKTIIDMMVFYQKSEMWDWAFELRPLVDEIEAITRFAWLCLDLSNRSLETLCKDVHTSLWWVLIMERDKDVIPAFRHYLSSDEGDKLKQAMSLWLEMIAEDRDDPEEEPSGLDTNILELLSP